VSRVRPGAKAAPRTRSTFRENAESLAWAVVLMLIVRTLLLQAFRIPSESMRETLLVGDFLFVSKVDYGPKVPFTRLRLPGLRAPRRGDIIVFQFPRDPSQDYIKRCIAVPGETVEIRDRRVFVNGRPIDEPYARHSDLPQEPAGLSPRDNLAPVTVPPGHLFMMGDNRENSLDSRFWGFLPMELVKGRAVFIYFSTGARSWWDLFFHVRWNRLLRVLR
jgi:signal peptidase I